MLMKDRSRAIRSSVRQEQHEAPAIDGDLLSVGDAAAALRVSQSTVWRWINRGVLPASRLGPKRILVKRSDLPALLTPARGSTPPRRAARTFRLLLTEHER